MSFVLTKGTDDEDATEFACVACACAYACVAIENQALPRPCLHGGRVTLGGGSPYLLGRVTLLGGLPFYHVKGRGRVTLPRGLSFRLADYCRICAIYKHDFVC